LLLAADVQLLLCQAVKLQAPCTST
jgi:hypothetical protein